MSSATSGIQHLPTASLIHKIEILSDQIAEAAGASHDTTHLVEQWDAINIELGRRGL
jgi:hypothetical protein